MESPIITEESNVIQVPRIGVANFLSARNERDTKGFGDVLAWADILRMLNQGGLDVVDRTLLQNDPEARREILCALHTYRLHHFLFDKTAQLRNFLDEYAVSRPKGKKSSSDPGAVIHDVVWTSRKEKSRIKELQIITKTRNNANVYDVILTQGSEEAYRLKFTIMDKGRWIFVIRLGVLLDYWPIYDIRAYSDLLKMLGLDFEYPIPKAYEHYWPHNILLDKRWPLLPYTCMVVKG